MTIKRRGADDDLPEGDWRTWHRNHRPASTGSWRAGLRSGEWTFWHPNGRRAAFGEFAAGEREGLWRTWHKNEAAESEGASLIVMTSHGSGGLGRMILGSVTESVLRGTRTPILNVRDVGAPVSRPLGATAVGATRDASAA